MRNALTLWLAAVLAFAPVTSSAFETDQFNLPPVELADIGPEIDAHVREAFISAAAKLNAEIASHEACVAGSVKAAKGCGSRESEKAAIAALLAAPAIERAVYDELGTGNLFVTRFGRWIRTHKFSAEPASYRSNYLRSIFVANPIDHFTLSPTVKLYGIEFGTDKLEHLFQQGYKYSTIRRDALVRKSGPADADLKAIKWGQRTERTYFGTLASGVYSNADLFANFAGMRFYQNLTAPVVVGGRRVGPVFRAVSGRWHLMPERSNASLAPFITEHLNEAFNPSGYSFTIYWSVRRAVRRNACGEWRRRLPDAKKADLEKRSADLKTWDGENYGSTPQKRTISVAAVCFAAE